MRDYLLSLTARPLTRRLARAAGVPTPQRLARAHGAYVAQPLAGRRCIFESVRDGVASAALQGALTHAGATVEALSGATVDAVVFDATGLESIGELKLLYDFFHEATSHLGANARVLVVGAVPEAAAESGLAAARRAVEGFVRSLAKEIGKRGATANLAYVAQGAEARLEALLRFLLSPRSTYVDGQPIHVSALAKAPRRVPWEAPLAGKVALVTGAARGIGAATAERLAAEGARVLCLDVAGERPALELLAARIDAGVLMIDVTAADAPERIAARLRDWGGGVDLVVHNAGVTRDKTLAKMHEGLWDQCLAVNLEAIVRIDAALQRQSLLRPEGRVVCLSSIAGIAGNIGQTNYAATKAGVMGYVAAQARRLAGQGVCVNAVAPGFIETRMMLAVPFLFREFARRFNSLSQGGVPLDVAELITFLCTPGACGVSGQTIRVCGQSLLGA